MIVRFNPPVTVPAEVCDIRYNANAVICQNTDRFYKPSSDYAEFLGFKHNIRPSSFTSPLLPMDMPIEEMVPVYETGLISFMMYAQLRQWSNPDTGVIEDIPDYMSNTWTQLGADYFGQTPGTSKQARTPNHGQQLFNISNGQYGYDIANGVPGSTGNAEFLELMQYFEDWFFGGFGYKASANAWQFGLQNAAPLMAPWFNSGRNSGGRTGAIRTAYGFNNGSYLGSPQVPTSRGDRISQASSTRYIDDLNTRGQSSADDRLQNAINNAISNKGFFNDFYHWHDAFLPDGNIVHLALNFSQIENFVGDAFVWRAGYGEAMEYFWYREMIDRVRATVHQSEVRVSVYWSDDYVDDVNSAGIAQKLRYDQINVPISVRINLAGTELEGSNIQSTEGGIISLGDDEYVIEIPFGQEEPGVKSVTLSATSLPDYYNLTRPSVTPFLSGSTITANMNMPCKAVLFKRDSGSGEETAVPVQRQNSFNTSHNFPVQSGMTYNVGIINNADLANISNDINT